MRVVSWNVNGLRAVLKNSGKSLKKFLDSLEADIICLQETKAAKDQLDSSTCIADGYSSYFSFCRVKGGYSGVVTFCRDTATPVRAEEGLTGVLVPGSLEDGVGHMGDCHASLSQEEMQSIDREGRAVLTEHTCEGVEGEGVRVVVVNVYCPMVDRENVNTERLDYKLLFYSVLQKRCTALEQAGRMVVVVGDLNCSREAIDSAYVQDEPALLHGSPEREWMKQFVISHPPPSSSSSTSPPSSSSSSSSPPAILLDTFRHLHPSQVQAYTCWSTVLDCRKTNYGTRIDYVLCSLLLEKSLTQAEVWAHVVGSDHCPVMAEFGKLRLSPSSKLPSLCSTLLLGRQAKLSAFLTSRPKPVAAAGEKESKQVSVTGEEGGRKGQTVAALKRRRTGGDLPSAKCQKAAKKPTLLSFFSAPSSMSSGEVSSPSDRHDGGREEQLGGLALCQDANSGQPCDSSLVDKDTSSTAQTTPISSSSSQLTQEWQSLFSGPPKPPLCGGHGEPCVLRTVKKAGPNRYRQFWVCARPGGSRGDAAAKCDFFQWLKPRTKGKS